MLKQIKDWWNGLELKVKVSFIFIGVLMFLLLIFFPILIILLIVCFGLAVSIINVLEYLLDL